MYDTTSMQCITTHTYFWSSTSCNCGDSKWADILFISISTKAVELLSLLSKTKKKKKTREIQISQQDNVSTLQ